MFYILSFSVFTILFIRYYCYCLFLSKHQKLAFRSCHALRERKLSDVRRILGAPVESNDETTMNLDKAVKQHLKDMAETFPMGDVERQVANQVCAVCERLKC